MHKMKLLTIFSLYFTIAHSVQLNGLLSPPISGASYSSAYGDYTSNSALIGPSIGQGIETGAISGSIGFGDNNGLGGIFRGGSYGTGGTPFVVGGIGSSSLNQFSERIPIPIPQPYPVTIPQSNPFTIAKPYPVNLAQAVNIPQPIQAPYSQSYPVRILRPFSPRVSSQTFPAVIRGGISSIGSQYSGGFGSAGTTGGDYAISGGGDDSYGGHSLTGQNVAGHPGIGQTYDINGGYKY